MRTGWGDRELHVEPHPITPWAAARRERLAAEFPGERLVIPSGAFKVRSNDTDYRFRAETAHTYLCGNQTSDARARGRGRRRGPLRPSAQLPRHRRVLPRPAVRRAVGRPAPLAAGDLRLARGADPPHRRAPCPARRVGQDPGAARRGQPRRPPGPGRRRAGRRAGAGALRAATGQGRVGGRRAPGRLRHHHARVRGLGPRVGPRARARRALDRGHLLPPGPRDGQRHRLRLDRRRWPARHHAALDRELRPGHARRPAPARHGCRGVLALHRRRDAHAAGRRHASPRCSATSTRWCWRRSRPASTPYDPGRRSALRTRQP